jgi:hypothetical protein
MKVESITNLMVPAQIVTAPNAGRRVLGPTTIVGMFNE